MGQKSIHPPQRCIPVRASVWEYGAVLLGLMLATGCQQAQGINTSTPPQAAQADMQAEAVLMARISAEIGDARCTHDSQCRTLPLGEKACGGAVSWLPWSTAISNPNLLSLWADQLAALQRQRNARSGIESNCLYLPDPGAICMDNHCVIRSPALSN